MPREGSFRDAIPIHAAAAAGAVLMAASFPPLDLAWLAWIAPVPWLVLLARGPRLSRAATSGALMWVVLHAITCTWMIHVMERFAELPLILELAAFGLGLVTMAPYGIVVGIAGAVWSRRMGALGLLVAALAWVATDLARARMALGFPWYVPGMSQAAVTWPVGVADLGGVHAVTLEVLLVNVTLAALVTALLAREARPRRLGWAGVGVAGPLAGAALLYSAFAQHAARPGPANVAEVVMRPDGTVVGEDAPWPAAGTVMDAASVRAALVQGSIAQEIVLQSTARDEEERADLALRLTEEALRRKADVVVWSEAAYPSSFGTMPVPMLQLMRQLGAYGTPARRPEAVIGGLAEAGSGDGGAGKPTATNAAILVDGNGPAGRYDKVYLVPFGEYVPAPRLFFWMKGLSGALPDNTLQPGSSVTPLAGRYARYGAFICYESVLPQHVRQIVRAGADVLVTITNDGWFDGTSVPEEHLRFARMRAVESRRYVLRCANTGITAAIAPDGSVLGRLHANGRGVLLAAVQRRTGLTVYDRLGDAPLAALSIVALVLVAAELIRLAADELLRRGWFRDGGAGL